MGAVLQTIRRRTDRNARGKVNIWLASFSDLIAILESETFTGGTITLTVPVPSDEQQIALSAMRVPKWNPSPFRHVHDTSEYACSLNVCLFDDDKYSTSADRQKRLFGNMAWIPAIARLCVKAAGPRDDYSLLYSQQQYLLDESDTDHNPDRENQLTRDVEVVYQSIFKAATAMAAGDPTLGGQAPGWRRTVATTSA